MLEFVDSDLYFIQDKNNFINPLLQVGSGSGSVEKITGSGSGGPKSTGSDRIRILIPDLMSLALCFNGLCLKGHAIFNSTFVVSLLHKSRD